MACSQILFEELGSTGFKFLIVSIDSPSNETESGETWCYDGKNLDLKEKRPGFVFAEGSKAPLDL